MKLLRTSIAVAALLSAVGAPEDAHAIDFKIKGEPLRLDLTESMFLSAHLDDGTADPTTKNYGELVNRLNAQLAWRQWLLAVRFDSGAWVHTPGPGTRSPYHDDAQHTCQPGAAALPGKTPMQSEQSCAIQAPNDGPTPDGSSLDRLRSAPGDEAIRNNPADNLRFRYHSHVVRRRIFGRPLDALNKDGTRNDDAVDADGIPRGVTMGVSPFFVEKVSLSYASRDVDLTLGDFYVNIGRGLILSIRKIDELGVDTTVTGAKVAVHSHGVNMMAMAGFSNIQNVDQATAQWTEDPNDFMSALHLDYRILNKVLLGANLLYGLPTRNASGKQNGADCGDWDYVLRPGLMVDAPKLLPWLAVYAEYARRQDYQAASTTCKLDAARGHRAGEQHEGNAFYASVGLQQSRMATWLFELKYYDRFQPFASSENPFGNIVYTQAPTLEQVTTQINNNRDIVAGRLRLDVRLSPLLSLYASGQLGRSNPTTNTTDRIVDVYGGAQVRWNAGRSHLFPQVGYRDEHQDAADPTGVVTPETEERLYSLTWDASQAFAKGISIETSGLIWWRRKGLPSDTTLVPPDAQLSAAQLQLRRDNAWTEGNVYVALRWAPKLVISAGYEFTTNAQEEHNTHHFFNGSILWNITSSTSLTLFGGGNRPGLKCVSGVCRVFPAFEGVRLELVVRL